MGDVNMNSTGGDLRGQTAVPFPGDPRHTTFHSLLPESGKPHSEDASLPWDQALCFPNAGEVMSVSALFPLHFGSHWLLLPAAISKGLLVKPKEWKNVIVACP